MQRKTDIIIFLLLAATSILAAENLQVLPASCEEDRFYVTPATADGQKVRFFTDTGGGLFITNAAAERLRLVSATAKMDGEKVSGVQLPAWRADAAIPAPSGLHVIPTMESSKPELKTGVYRGIDGLLGAAWFQRTWTFDYPGRRLLLRPNGDLPAHRPDQETRLGFQTNPKTQTRTTNFPRITVRIDGKPVDLLLDTGASTELKEAAHKQIGDGRAAVRATSFITATIFARWHENHPDWTVIDGAEVGTNEAMIEVPQIEIAGRGVGPVWFTRRTDKNFREGMSQWMDQTIDGSLGGNALRNFRVTLSYSTAIAIFE